MDEQADRPEGARRTSGRRGAARSAGRSTAKVDQLPWLHLSNPFPAQGLVSEDALEAIHQASLTLLEEFGMDFLLPEARELLKAAGADVSPDSQRVRFDRTMIETLVAKAPSQFTLHARNPAHNLHIGGNSMAVCAVASAPNVSDLDGGRRPGNQNDFRNLTRLAQSLNIIHAMGGYPVEPIDIHPSIRHLEALRDFVVLTDKVFHVYSLGRERNLDGIEIVRIGRGVSYEQLEREPSSFTIINTNSPLKLDEFMLRGIIEMAGRNQAVVITPFTLAGAMAPVTLAGALVQQNAEALAGLAFTQLVRAGAPVMYGGFTSNVDMKSGAPAFGTPEYMKAVLVGGQLARKYGVPYRSSNVNASNPVDAQAAYESVFSLWATAQAHTNLLMHGCGWMEGGLVASFEKMVLDADLLQMVAEFMKPVAVDTEELALDAIRAVGPGGHFFGSPHTMSRYEHAFYAPMISDWRNFEAWQLAGAPDAAQRANTLMKRLLAEYEAPPLDAATAEELDAFVARRKAEGGAPSDF